MNAAARPARVLVAAGHDSGHGAGVDADREAIERLGAEACLVVTARTRQEGGRVLDLGARPAAEWLTEAARLVAEEPRPAVLKTGLLAGAEHVAAAAQLARAFQAAHGGEAWIIVDPVLAASGGEVFLDERGVAALLAELLPVGVVLTPNLAEAARLTGLPAEELEQDDVARLAAARALIARGARAVLLKDGHGRKDPARDLLVDRAGEARWLEHPRVAGGSLHGSGCRFASAVAAGLALGRTLEEAARRAGTWLAARIAAGATRR